MATVSPDVFPSNSHTSKEHREAPKKEIRRVVKSDLQERKRPLGERVIGLFVSEDVGDVRGYLLHDVLVPAMKDTISDLVNNGINMVLYGDTRGRASSRYSDSPSYTKYYKGGASYGSSSRYSSSGSVPFEPDRENRPMTRNDYSPYRWQDVIIPSRSEAQDVLAQMIEILQMYDVVSVADLCEMLGMDTVYTDNKYGWVNLDSGTVQQVRGGYLLRLPRPKAIEN